MSCAHDWLEGGLGHWVLQYYCSIVIRVRHRGCMNWDGSGKTCTVDERIKYIHMLLTQLMHREVRRQACVFLFRVFIGFDFFPSYFTVQHCIPRGICIYPHHTKQAILIVKVRFNKVYVECHSSFLCIAQLVSSQYHLPFKQLVRVSLYTANLPLQIPQLGQFFLVSQVDLWANFFGSGQNLVCDGVCQDHVDLVSFALFQRSLDSGNRSHWCSCGSRGPCWHCKIQGMKCAIHHLIWCGTPHEQLPSLLCMCAGEPHSWSAGARWCSQLGACWHRGWCFVQGER